MFGSGFISTLLAQELNPGTLDTFPARLGCGDVKEVRPIQSNKCLQNKLESDSRFELKEDMDQYYFYWHNDKCFTVLRDDIES